MGNNIKVIVAIIIGILALAVIIEPLFISERESSEMMVEGNIALQVSKGGLIGNIFAFIQPSIDVLPGDMVQFDSREYMNCGLCDLTNFESYIEGYTIKVYNSNGNLIEEQWFLNDPDAQWGAVCGEYANFVYYYDVPMDAESGSWRIELEIVISSLFPYNPDCIVAQDEGTFTVGEDCANKDNELQYCIDENTLYYKPANSCEVIYTNCDDVFGTGYKCQDSECQFVEVCGDGICDEFENPNNCYIDCGSCGDNLCTPPYENAESCPEDCAECGDGYCDPSEWLYCGADCADCGDGDCYWYEKKDEEFYCSIDCDGGEPWCGDGFCSGDEDCANCVADCACGFGYTCEGGLDMGLFGSKCEVDTETMILIVIGVLGGLTLLMLGVKTLRK